MIQALVAAIAATMLALPVAKAPPSPAPTYGPARAVAGGEALPFSLPTAQGRQVTGEIYRAGGRRAHPVVLFVHWLGDPPSTNHTEFEADAEALAGQGISSLLVDAMWSRPGWVGTVGKDPAADAAATRNQVADLRAALDLLLAQPRADRRRVAVVAHDFGAMVAALMAAEDGRAQTYVLIAGNSDLAEWYTYGKAVPPGYAKDLGIDVTAALKTAQPRAVLFQFARRDRYIPTDRARAFAAASPVPPTVLVYDDDHRLGLPQAFQDRQAWLLKQLK